MNTKLSLPVTDNCDAGADETLAAAQDMPPDPERIKALQKASGLRSAVNTYGLVFKKRVRSFK